MKKISGNELKSVQLEILDYTDEFCKKNNIKYWLDSGTLLGAVRHKGYIPWDDDIDIGMLREDYDKFMNTFNSNNSGKYRFYSIENNEEFLYSFGKILDTETILYEPNGMRNALSINIDVFVYDNAPDKDAELNRMYNRRDRYRLIQNLRIARNKPNGNIFRRTMVYLLRGIVRVTTIFLPENYYIKKIINNSKKFNNIPTKCVGDFSAFSRIEACEKSIFRDFVNVTFENKLYPAPVDYDKWLTAFYGDYMTLPPVEKRVTHHTFEAYKK